MDKKYISAGAGSGKTYRITTHVAQLIKEKKLKPEQVIMTTFTKAAAQELREKAKKELNNIGLSSEAMQMEHAIIGTVHSVANTFLSKYWYLLGIMPDAAAMEEDELRMYRDHSLRGLLTNEERKFLFYYAETYQVAYPQSEHRPGVNYEFWKEDLCKVLDYMQWYKICDEELGDSVEMTDSVIECMTAKGSLSEYLTDKFYTEVEEFFGLKKKLTDKQQECKDFYYSMKDANDASDIAEEYLKNIALEITSEKVKYKLNGPAAQRLTSFIVSSTCFTEQSAKDQHEYAVIVFNLAKRWRSMYRAYKDEHHLIDFNDMEEMFLTLLDDAEVQSDIMSSYTHLFVDEFQDSNPMQVRIFQKLSTLLNTTYVGDKKQAIYGFRGSDTDLTSAVADSFDSKDKETLPHSYRSVEPLVKFSNSIFTRVFCNMPEKEVALSMPPANGNGTEVEKPLRIWNWKKDNELAMQIQQLILREGIEPKDIAVLARDNAELDRLAEALRVLHVPVCREHTDIKESRTGRLIKALLTIVATPNNQLARAEVAYLTMPDYGVARMIEERLEHIEKNKEQQSYLMSSPLVCRLFELLKYSEDAESGYSKNILGYQSISALIETLIIELDLYALVQSWDNAMAEETNLQEFVNLARKYEDNATKTAMPATVTGFIDYFTKQKQKGAANDSGVRLYTYHKSKGLEWKVVIMLSLSEDAKDATKIAARCMLGCHCHREQKPTAENVNPPMTISLVRNIYGKTNEAKDAVTAAMQKHRLWQSICEQEEGESARLLYVGVTRAREILILAPKGQNIRWFTSVGIEDAETPSLESGNQEVFGYGLCFAVENIEDNELLSWQDKKLEKVHDFATKLSPMDNPRYLSPSKVARKLHDIVPLNQTEHRMLVSIKKEEEARMGDFIHQVFCCCDEGISVEQILRLRDSYGFGEKNIKATELPKLLEAWQCLTDMLTSRYGAAVKRHHERPFRHCDSEGHVLTGYIDFIWETAEGYVIVDYKTCPGAYNLVFSPASEHYAGNHGEQLDCYERALMAEGKKPVIARIIYYPVTQFVVEVK